MLKLMAVSKKTLFETGGGPHIKPYEAQSELEKNLYSTIQISAEGLPSTFDSDAPILIPSAPEIHEQYEEVLVVSEEDSLDHDGILIYNEPSSYNTYKESQPACLTTSHVDPENVQSTSQIDTHNDDSLWSPLNATKCLRTKEKNSKLAVGKNNCKFKKRTVNKKRCMSSAGLKFEELADNKMDLVSLQQQFLEQQMLQSSAEHEAKLKYMAEEHALKIELLKLEIESK
ncbi:uncharacterized protein LOC126836923, partial [Adelges cooleyi]|uniref:uncharacterized protein LOC126836923 n=1 Tax=Adelges cooleyi TaxID=133065 RepID=UPI00218036ED